MGRCLMCGRITFWCRIGPVRWPMRIQRIFGDRLDCGGDCLRCIKWAESE